MEQSIIVGMCDIKIAVGSADQTGKHIQVMTVLGLGSCIGICAFDPTSKIAGMAHVVLPESLDVDSDTPGKFGDTAVPALIDGMCKSGAYRSRIQVAIAGGAQLFDFGGGTSRMEIGARNASSVSESLAKYGIPVIAQDVGGKSGRTVRFFTENGLIIVKTLGQGEHDLVDLSRPVKPAKLRAS